MHAKWRLKVQSDAQLFLFCVLADLLGSYSVPQSLTPRVILEEGPFHFWRRRRTVSAGSISPHASPGEGICLRATSAISWPKCCLLGASAISRVKPLPIQKMQEVPVHPSPGAPGLACLPEKWKVGTFRARHMTLLFSSAPGRVQMYKWPRVSGEVGIFLAVTWLMFPVMYREFVFLFCVDYILLGIAKAPRVWDRCFSCIHIGITVIIVN